MFLYIIDIFGLQTLVCIRTNFSLLFRHFSFAVKQLSELYLASLFLNFVFVYRFRR
jgi:hypothetical protein